jgi:galactokinase
MRTFLPLEHKTAPGNESSRNIDSTAKTLPDAASALANEARSRWGRRARLFRSPGRVNLIGEHTDYNDGFVLPAAIEFSTWAAAVHRDDGIFVARSENFAETFEFRLDALPKAPERHWTDYVVGVLRAALDAGWRGHGAEFLIWGEVPIGAGLSSSAALETVVALALFSITGSATGTEMTRTEIAQLCQRAEREFVGAQVGIMDQFVACHARSSHALLLDCRSLEHRYVRLPESAKLVVCNTMVHHSLASSAYNQRRAECEEGVRLLALRLPGIRALRDIIPEQLEQFRDDLPPVIYRRCRHVIRENGRVLAASAALEHNDLRRFGELMFQSHQSLRDDYDVSCAELDLMVELASALPGVYGARMTGGGFGGCTINLVSADDADAFRTEIAERYFSATGKKPAIYITGAADGAEEIMLT